MVREIINQDVKNIITNNMAINILKNIFRTSDTCVYIRNNGADIGNENNGNNSENNNENNDIWINQRFSDILGYTIDDLRKMDIEDICLEHDKTFNKIRLKDNNIVHSRWEKHTVENYCVILITIYSINEIILNKYQNDTRNYLNGIIGFSNILIHNKTDADEYISNITECGHMILEALDELSANKQVNKQVNNESANKQTNNESANKQINNESANKQINNESANKQINNESVNNQADSESADKQTNNDNFVDTLPNLYNLDKISDTDMITILHIEDNQITVELTKAMLSNFNDNVNYYYANTGEKGLELIRKLKPEIILLDINLPDINGRDIYDIVKKEGLLKKRHVIFISALDNNLMTDTSLSPETEHYFKKPISGYQFCKLLNSTIENIYTKYYE
jgi:CheY-like chemotaxis protein